MSLLGRGVNSSSPVSTDITVEEERGTSLPVTRNESPGSLLKFIQHHFGKGAGEQQQSFTEVEVENPHSAFVNMVGKATIFCAVWLSRVVIV